MKFSIIFFFVFFFLSCSYEKTNNKESIDLSFLNKQTPNIDNGKKIFEQSCKACHLYGTANAIILNDKKSWEILLTEKKFQDIYLNVLNGYIGKNGPMPKKGACIQCSNIDLFDAINYILAFNNLSL